MNWYGPRGKCGCCDTPPPNPCGCLPHPCLEGGRQISEIRVEVEFSDWERIIDSQGVSSCNLFDPCYLKWARSYSYFKLHLSELNGTYDIPYLVWDGSEFVEGDPLGDQCGGWFFPRIPIEVPVTEYTETTYQDNCRPATMVPGSSSLSLRYDLLTGLIFGDSSLYWNVPYVPLHLRQFYDSLPATPSQSTPSPPPDVTTNISFDLFAPDCSDQVSQSYSGNVQSCPSPVMPAHDQLASAWSRTPGWQITNIPVSPVEGGPEPDANTEQYGSLRGCMSNGCFIGHTKLEVEVEEYEYTNTWTGFCDSVGSVPSHVIETWGGITKRHEAILTI